MTLVDLLVVGLAVAHAVEVYNHGSIMADIRARDQSSNVQFIVDLSNCMFCLSLWVALVISAYWLLLPVQLCGVPIFRIPVYALAVARLSNLFNDLTYRFNRTPKE